MLSMVLFCLLGAPADVLSNATDLILHDLKYGEGIRQLEPLTADHDLPAEDRMTIYRLLGIAYVATEAPEAAEAAFVALLELEPNYEADPLWSPKIRVVFERARARVARPVRLFDVIAIPQRRTLTVNAAVDDPQNRLHAVLLHSRIGGGEYAVHPMTRRENGVSGSVSLPRQDRVRVEYFLSAIDQDRSVLARTGSLDAPSSVVVQRPRIVATPPPAAVKPEAWYEKWWVWAVTGAVVAGAVTAAILIPGGSAEPPSGTLDSITLDP